MSDNLISQQLSIPGNQMAQMEPITNKLDASMSMELMDFGTNESLQQQIPSNMPIGQVESGSKDCGPQMSSMSNQQGEHIGSQAYIQLSQQYLMTNQPVGDIIPSMLDSPKPHELLTLNKRKAPMEPISPNSAPQNLLFQNKRVAQMEHRPLLQPISAPGKRTVLMRSVSNSPGSQPSPSLNKRLAPNKSGSSASRNQPAQMRSSAKVQAESSESVRSKMRESLVGALSLVSQQRNENAMVDKNSNHEAASTHRKTKEDSCTIDSNSVNSDAAHSISAEPQGLLLSNRDGFTDGNSSDVPQSMQRDEQQLESSNLLPDEDVPFSDNIFARDELLQGNGLSWVLEPETDAAKKKEIETVDNEKVGKEDLEQSLLSPQELACQIEAELFKLFGGVNKKYKEKGRSLLFNLKDRNNPELRERVVSGEIPPKRLCSMSAEELASKELSQWRQAKAEELAQMVVLPDVEVDIRRLVRKTHKGEFQVEVEPTDSASVEVSAGTSISRRPKAEVQQAPTNGKTDGKKDESNSAGEKSNLEDPNLTITIPSSEGPDPMQGLMGEDEMKDTDFLPPIVSLDEFMQSLDSEPLFENLPGDAGKATSISDKSDTESGSDSKSSGRATQDPVDTVVHDKTGSIDASNPKPDSDDRLIDIPAKTETSASAANLKGDHVWEGTLQLTITVLTSVICTFKSGEKTSTENWSSSLEIKGRVRLDAFEKFLQELPMSRSRAVMVVHFVCKEGSTESDRGSLVEAADSYIMDGRVGFAEAASGVELYFCPPHAKTLEMLTKILPKDQLEALNAIDNGLIGVVVWRKAHLISPNSTSHHKHTSKRQHSTSRRHQEKDATNMNTNFPSKPTFSHAAPLHSKPPPDDDDDNDDVPPGFGPATSRDEDDLPEFNFSGGSNPSGPQYPKRVGMASSHLHLPTSSRPVDQMRELIQKYGQPSANAPLGVPMQQWDDDDDDDIPEWQPQTTQHPSQVHRVQQPMHALQQLPHQSLPTMHVQGQQNAAQSWRQQQQGTWWVPPPGSQDQQFVNGAQFYGTALGSRQPAYAPNNSRGF